jgi:ribosome biogenesis protein BMS1
MRVYTHTILRSLNLGMRVHIPGCGDVTADSVELLSDPCPPPKQDPDGKVKKRRLDERDKLIYAPMSDVGGVLYDQDATFVDMPHLKVLDGDCAL